MKVVSTVAELRQLIPGSGTVGFVPTMGALHEGHQSLINRARSENDFAVVSIFVNPAQFAPGEDFDRYPRTLESDLERCREVDAVFVPGVPEMYPVFPPAAKVTFPELADKLEGEVRPGHFDGVGLVVSKLFNIVGPCRAYFGKKDRQQLAIIRRLVLDLNFPVDVIGCETVRESDGLALSSRNVYLSDDERARAVKLSRALFSINESRSSDVAELRASALQILDGETVDYLVIADPDNLDPVTELTRPAVALGAMRLGNTRLIDNLDIDPK